jgi:uncharacterized damage-inducible protein DinB
VRVDPNQTADERTSLLEFLDFQRASILLKTEGLSQAQLNQSLAPSTMTLGGLLKHLALVEDTWIQERFLGLPKLEPWLGAPLEDDPDWEWHSAVRDEPEYLRDLYAASCERNRSGILHSQLDDLAVVQSRGWPWTLRWVMLHLIEETARHAGHADLIRESIDGVTGE